MKAELILRTHEKPEKTMWLSSAVIAGLLGLVFSLGLELRVGESIHIGRGFARFAVLFVGWFLIVLCLEWLCVKMGDKRQAGVPRFMSLWLLFFAAAVPALLAYCPGIVAYDATAQILQGIDGAYKTNHPLLHTLLLSGCVRLGKGLHSYTLGAGLYSLIQMAGMAALFARCVQVLARLGVSRRALTATILFYVIYPVHAIMMISTTKDTLFSGLVALLLLRTIEALRMGKAFFACKRKIILYVVLAAMTCLWRNNGIIALVAMAVVCMGVSRGVRMRVAVLFAASICVYWGVQEALSVAFMAKGGNALEALSVPLQQMARVARYHGDELPEELAQELQEFMPLGEENQYAPQLVDPVKMEMKKSGYPEDLKTFLTLWWKLGRIYPQDYADAAILLNQGAWNPLDTTHASVYNMWEAGQHGYLQTKFQRHIDDERGILLDQKSFLPGLQALYERFCTDNVQLAHPIVRIFFAPAGMAMVCMCAMIRFAVRRRKAEAAAVAFLAGLLLSQLLGPCALVRYAYPFFVSAPLLVALQNEKCINDLA